MAHAVFISHRSRNDAVADEVCRVLEGQGITCWIDHRDIPPGSEWDAQVGEALNSAQVMVLVLSEEAAKSQNVGNEVSMAANGGKIVIPFKIENVALPPRLQLWLGTRNWVEAMTVPLAPHIERVARQIKALLGAMASQLLQPSATSSGDGASLEAFRAVVVAAAADGQITDEETCHIDILAGQHGITPDTAKSIIDEALARRRTGDLPPAADAPVATEPVRTTAVGAGAAGLVKEHKPMQESAEAPGVALSEKEEVAVRKRHKQWVILMETDLTDRYARRLKGTIPDREIRGWRPYAGRFGGVAATSRGETWIRLWCDPLVYEEESSGRPKVYLWSRLSVLFRLDIAQATALAVVVGDSGASRPERKPPMTHLELYRELLSPTFPAALAYGDYQKVAEAAAARVRDGRMPKREVACALQRSFGDAGLDWALYEECNTDGYYTAKVRRLRPWAAEVYEGIGSFGFSVDFNFPIAMLWRIRFTVDVPVPAWYDQFKAKVIETMDQLVTAVSAQRPSALRGLA